jgi:Gram-negative bacterial TonB protein C-terminal
MSTLVKLWLASMIAGWMIPGASLASLLQASQQQTTPTPAADADKQPDIPAKPNQSRPNPDASGRYHVGDGVTPPKLIHSVEPAYSKRMRKFEVAGTCVIDLTVDSEGDPQNVHVFKWITKNKTEDLSDAELEAQDVSVKAVQQYRFEPANYQGKPVPVEIQVEIHFQIASRQY